MKKKIGYMCSIDFDHELGEAPGGTEVYPSLDDLKKNHKHWKSCGVVKVEITKLEVVVKQKLWP